MLDADLSFVTSFSMAYERGLSYADQYVMKLVAVKKVKRPDTSGLFMCEKRTVSA
jgi:hypothetical protein